MDEELHTVLGAGETHTCPCSLSLGCCEVKKTWMKMVMMMKVIKRKKKKEGRETCRRGRGRRKRGRRRGEEEKNEKDCDEEGNSGLHLLHSWGARHTFCLLGSILIVFM